MNFFRLFWPQSIEGR